MQPECKVLGALGLAARSRNLIIGVPMICEALQGNQKIRLVLEASDNAQNSKKKIEDKCKSHEVECVLLQITGEQLAQAIGKQSKVSAVAIADENFEKLVRKALGILA